MWARFWWSVLWRWCPECIHNATDRADAVNSAIYWKQTSEDVRDCATSRGIALDRLIRAWPGDRAMLGELADQIEGDGTAPSETLAFAAAEIRRIVGWIETEMPR